MTQAARGRAATRSLAAAVRHWLIVYSRPDGQLSDGQVAIAERFVV